MELAAGRNFSRDFGADSSGIILNESAVRAFGWARAAGGGALGHTLSHMDDGVKSTWHVIGVVKDFHFRSMHEPITPVVMVMGKEYGTTIVRVKTADVAGVLAGMQKLWTGFKAEAPFSYSFLDEDFNAIYKAEFNIGRILGLFAGLTIFVACLGLFGLAELRRSCFATLLLVRNLRTARLYGGAAYPGDRHPESAGGDRYPYRGNALGGFFKIGRAGLSFGRARRLVCHEQVVTGLCLSYYHWLGDLFTSRLFSPYNNHRHHQPSGHPRRDG
jgi:hypothetical protein